MPCVFPTKTPMPYPASLKPLCGALPLVLVCLAGCASPGGGASHAVPRAPASLGAALSQGLAPWPQDHWWSAYGDPQLDSLVAEALQDNPSLKVAQARVAKARALADSTGALRFPGISANLDVTRQRYTENGLIPPPLAGSTSNSGQLTLDFAYDLDFWGRNRQLFSAALSQGRAEAAEEQGMRLVLAAAVVQGYVRLDRLHTLREVARDQDTQSQRMLELEQRLQAAGLATEGDVAGAASAAAAARQEIQALEEQIVLQGHQLAALAGKGPEFATTLGRPKLHDIAGGASAATLADSLPSVLPADLLGRRPDLAAARWRVEAAKGNAAAARASFYPNVNLLAFVGYSSIGLGQLLKSGSGIAGLGPAVSLPLFDGGRLRANLDSANADQDAAIEQYNEILLQAVREVADQATSLHALTGQARESRNALEQSTRARELARIRFQAGLSSELTALTADNAWLQRRRAEADLLERSREARIGLIKALGGGYRGDLAEPAAAPPSPFEQSASRSEQQ